MERKYTDRQYHVQDNADVDLKDVKMYCNTNQFPVLSFSGPYSKPHGARGLSKHYHLRFDPKLGMEVCAIQRIPCDCESIQLRMGLSLPFLRDKYLCTSLLIMRTRFSCT